MRGNFGERAGLVAALRVAVDSTRRNAELNEAMKRSDRRIKKTGAKR
jgi:hypothetical protein